MIAFPFMHFFLGLNNFLVIVSIYFHSLFWQKCKTPFQGQKYLVITFLSLFTLSLTSEKHLRIVFSFPLIWINSLLCCTLVISPLLLCCISGVVIFSFLYLFPHFDRTQSWIASCQISHRGILILRLFHVRKKYHSCILTLGRLGLHNLC